MKKKYVSPKIEVHELDRNVCLMMTSDEIQMVESQNQLDSSKKVNPSERPSKESYNDAFGGKTPFDEK